MVNECHKLNHDSDSYTMMQIFQIHEVKINECLIYTQPWYGQLQYTTIWIRINLP